LDPEARSLLEAFDAPEPARDSPALSPTLSLDGLARSLGRDAAGLKPLASALVACGWLRLAVPEASPETAHGGVYQRTEDGRLALRGPLDVTLYTRPGCHLCEEAKAQIDPLLRLVGATLHEINIDEDAVLRQRYNVDIPVILLGARKIGKHRVDLEQFRRQLEEARRNADKSDRGTLRRDIEG
jgi:glutaredoxin